MGNGILLVTDDPYGGRGILYVIDVRNPRRPRLLSTYSTWVPGLFLTEDSRRTRRRRGRHRAHRLVHPGLPLRVAGRVSRRHRGGGPARSGPAALRRPGASRRRVGLLEPRRAGGLARPGLGGGGEGHRRLRHREPGAPAAGHPHQPQRLARPLQRLHPPQLAAGVGRHAAGDRGGLRRRLPPRGLVPDLADPRPHHAPARPLRRGARRPAAGGLLRPLLRPQRRARGGRLLRGRPAAARRAQPAPHPPGGLPHARGARCSGPRCSRRAIRRWSTRSTTPAASTCCRSTAARCARCAAGPCGAGAGPPGRVDLGVQVDDGLETGPPRRER